MSNQNGRRPFDEFGVAPVVSNRPRLPARSVIAAIFLCLTTTSIIPLVPIARAQQITTISRDFSAEAEAVRQSVTNQPRTEYQPLGIRLGQLLGLDEGPFSPTPLDPPLTPLKPGEDPEKIRQGFRDSRLDSLLLRPAVSLDMIFDDNIFRQSGNESSDRIFVLEPELVLATDWLNHRVTARAGVSIGRYMDFEAEDFEDYFLSLSPLIDVDENTTLSLDFGYSSTHSERGSTDTLLEGPEPAIDETLNFSANWLYQSDKYSARMLYEFSHDNAVDNGLIERDFLDNSSQVLVFRQGYDFTTGTTGWIQPGLEWIDYRLSRDSTGLVRDNQGWTLLAGVTINRTAVSFLELGLGVMSRSFEQAGQDDFFGFAYEGRLLWNIAPLVTLDISAGRSARVVQSTTGPIAVDDEVSLELAWDPMENLIFQLGASYTRSDYETLPGQARTEDLVEANLNVRYLLNENMYFEANYDFGKLSSNLIGDTV